MRRRRIVFVGLAIPFVLVASALLYVRFGDLGRFRGTVERSLSDLLGRRVAIEGSFDPEIRWFSPSTVLAEQVTLANRPGSEPEAMARVGRVFLSVDLLSLIRRPIVVHEITVEDAALALEVDADGRPNWGLGAPGTTPPEPPADAGPPRIPTLEHVALRNVEVTYRDAVRDLERHARIDEVDLSLGAEGRVDVRLDGSVDGEPVSARGAVGRLPDLYEGRHVEVSLEGAAGDDRFRVEASVEDLADVEHVRAGVEIAGPAAESVASRFGLPSLGEGPYRASFEVAPGAEGADVAVAVAVDRLSVRADGSVDSLTRPRSARASVEASGPDLRAVGAWLGVERLPAGPFSVAGEARVVEGAVEVSDLELRAGEAHANIDGRIGTAGALRGSDLALAIEIADLSSWSDLLGTDLPGERLRASGRIARTDGGYRIDDLEASVGAIDARGSGSVTERRGLAGSRVRIEARGPRPGWIAERLAIDLPQEPFEVDGAVTLGQGSLRLDGTTVRLGGHDVRIDGTLSTAPGLVGTDVTLRAEGPDVASIAAPLGLGRPIEGAYEVSGRVRVEDGGYVLDDVRLGLDGIEARADGRLGAWPGLEGSDLDVSVRGPRLSDLSELAGVDRLPDDPFDLSTHVRIDAGLATVENGVAALGSHRGSLDGVIGIESIRSGTDVRVAVDGADLADVSRLLRAFGVDGVPDLPAGAYRVAARVRPEEGRVAFDDLRVEAGEATIEGQGVVVDADDRVGTDVTWSARGPDASIFRFAIPGMRALPFETSGRIVRTATGADLDETRFRIGRLRAFANGAVGEPPELVGTALDLELSGPSLEQLAAAFELDGYPDLPFSFVGHFDGTPAAFVVDRLEASVGGSDVTGTLRADLGDRIDVDGSLRSKAIDLVELSGVDLETVDEPPSGEDGLSSEGAAKPKYRFSHDPLDLAVLDRGDVEIDWTIDALTTAPIRLADVKVHADVRDGGVREVRVEASDLTGGSATLRGSVVPVDAGWAVSVDAGARGVELRTWGAAESETDRPRFDLDASFAGVGRSPHDLASTASGRAVAVLGPGTMDTRVLDLLATDLLRKILDTLNPFRKKNPVSRVECGVAAVDVVDGRLVVRDLVARTEKATIVASGRVDFRTEELDLEWAMKPRSGIGISAATIANPYVKVGGTLADPGLEVKPIEAVTSTGLAVATGGLSLLGKGLWDRITAEVNICNRADPLLEEMGVVRRDAPKKKRKR